MTILDYIVIGIGFISVFLGITRGVIKEVISLAGWFIAFYVASRYAESFEPLLPRVIEDPSLRMLSLFVVVFFIVLLLVMFCSILLSKLIRSVGLGLIDRVLGSIFGLARGFAIVLSLVLAAGFTALPKQPFWQQAVLSDPLEKAAVQVIPWLPESFRGHISFDK